MVQLIVYNLDTTAKQAVTVWAYDAKRRRHCLGEEMYGI